MQQWPSLVVDGEAGPFWDNYISTWITSLKHHLSFMSTLGVWFLSLTLMYTALLLLFLVKIWSVSKHLRKCWQQIEFTNCSCGVRSVCVLNWKWVCSPQRRLRFNWKGRKGKLILIQNTWFHFCRILEAPHRKTFHCLAAASSYSSAVWSLFLLATYLINPTKGKQTNIQTTQSITTNWDKKSLLDFWTKRVGTEQDEPIRTIPCQLCFQPSEGGLGGE